VQESTLLNSYVDRLVVETIIPVLMGLAIYLPSKILFLQVFYIYIIENRLIYEDIQK
jgi:hypothetical protein